MSVLNKMYNSKHNVKYIIPNKIKCIIPNILYDK